MGGDLCDPVPDREQNRNSLDFRIPLGAVKDGLAVPLVGHLFLGEREVVRIYTALPRLDPSTCKRSPVRVRWVTPVFKTSVKIGNKSICMSDHMDDPMETHFNSSLIAF